MNESNRRALYTILSLAALLVAGCDPEVDLGGNPDAGSPATSDAEPPGVDAGSVADAGAADAGSTDAGAPGAVEVSAHAMLFDVFDGADHALSFELRVRIADPTDVPHDVRPQRLEVLDSAGAVLSSYALDPGPLPLSGRGNGRPDLQAYGGWTTHPSTSVFTALTDACATDRFPSRLLDETVRLVVEVDGVEHVRDQSVPSGTGGFPPMRPLVLCHEGARLERQYDPFYSSAFLGVVLRTDGAYEAGLWDDISATVYTSATVRAVDMDVRVSPVSARFWPSRFPTFTVSMSADACPASGCPFRSLIDRWIPGQPTAPFAIPGTMSHWCHEPDPGAPDFSATKAWPPTATGASGWQCRQGAVGDGEGLGIARFAGTTDAGPVGVEVLVASGGWYHREPSMR